MTPRIISVSLTLALALALAGPAPAKGIESITACGAERLQGHHSGEPQLGGVRLRQRRHRRSEARELLPDHDRHRRGAARCTTAGRSCSRPYARKVRVPGEGPGNVRWLALFDGRAERLQRMIGDVQPFPADRLPATVARDRPDGPGRRGLPARRRERGRRRRRRLRRAGPWSAAALVIGRARLRRAGAARAQAQGRRQRGVTARVTPASARRGGRRAGPRSRPPGRGHEGRRSAGGETVSSAKPRPYAAAAAPAFHGQPERLSGAGATELPPAGTPRRDP